MYGADAAESNFWAEQAASDIKELETLAHKYAVKPSAPVPAPSLYKATAKTTTPSTGLPIALAVLLVGAFFVLR